MNVRAGISKKKKSLRSLSKDHYFSQCSYKINLSVIFVLRKLNISTDEVPKLTMLFHVLDFFLELSETSANLSLVSYQVHDFLVLIS